MDDELAQQMDGAGPAAVLAALADPTRRQVICSLAREGPATATELAARLPVTRQAVTKHIAALTAAAMVEPSREGRETRYRLLPERLGAAAAWIGAVSADAARHPPRPRRAG